jgi:hypothetical protein
MLPIRLSFNRLGQATGVIITDSGILSTGFLKNFRIFSKNCFLIEKVRILSYLDLIPKPRLWLEKVSLLGQFVTDPTDFLHF